MNPFLFKAHALLAATLGLVLNPAGSAPALWVKLAALYLSMNLPWALVLMLALRKAANLRLGYGQAYVAALPALLLFLPLVLTLLDDIIHHAFLWRERFIFVFAVAVAGLLGTAGYGLLVRHPRSGKPIGLEAGLVVAMALLLASVPYGLLLLGLDAAFGIFRMP